MDKREMLDKFPERFHPLIKGIYYTAFPDNNGSRDPDFKGWDMTLGGVQIRIEE